MASPNFTRGGQITSVELNKLADQIRANTVTSVIGGSFSRTPGGTAIVIDQQVRNFETVCPFRVTDTSTGGTLEINIACERIKPTDRYPQGASADAPNLRLQIPHKKAWFGIYMLVVVDQKNNILPGDTSITIFASETWLESTSTEQFTYLAGITVDEDADGNLQISSIENACPVGQVQPIPTCPFLVEPYEETTSTTAKIQIRNGRIDGQYPTGMNGIDTYALEVPTTSEFFWVYCVMVVQDGVIQHGPNDVTFSIEAEQQESTDTLVYFNIAQLTTSYTADSPTRRYASWIWNACTVPFVAGKGGTSAPCPFRLTNATEESTLKVQVAITTVQTTTGARYPQGMSLGGPAFKLTLANTSYIYCKLQYVENDVILDSAEDAITVLQSETILPNEVNVEYVLLGTVEVSGNDPDKRISKITSVCLPVSPNPCNLQWA